MEPGFLIQSRHLTIRCACDSCKWCCAAIFANHMESLCRASTTIQTKRAGLWTHRLVQILEPCNLLFASRTRGPSFIYPWSRRQVEDLFCEQESYITLLMSYFLSVSPSDHLSVCWHPLFFRFAIRLCRTIICLVHPLSPQV